MAEDGRYIRLQAARENIETSQQVSLEKFFFHKPNSKNNVKLKIRIAHLKGSHDRMDETLENYEVRIIKLEQPAMAN